MPSLPYQRDIPNPPNSPSTDVPNMKTNTNSIDDIWQADHFSFSATNPGIHKQSTYETKGLSDVSTSVTQGAVYTKTIGSIVELFYRQNSNATPIQLTGQSSLNFNGSEFLPGGLIMKWGVEPIVGTSTPVAFPIAFPANIFIVIAQPISSSSAKFLGVSYGTDGGTAAGFNFKLPTNPAGLNNFYWFAIGN